MWALDAGIGAVIGRPQVENILEIGEGALVEIGELLIEAHDSRGGQTSRLRDSVCTSGLKYLQ